MNRNIFTSYKYFYIYCNIFIKINKLIDERNQTFSIIIIIV